MNSPGAPGGKGGAASGAGLFNGGTASLVNCTFAGNQGTGGLGGQGGAGGCSFVGVWPGYLYAEGASGGNGGDASGAIADSTGLCCLTNCTIALNSATGGDCGPGGLGNPDGAAGVNGAAVGGIFALGCQLANSLLADNFPGGNFGGTNVDLGHNLSSDASCGFTNAGSLNDTDPKLGPLADNGGPTLTLALLPGSPAIDAADTAISPPTDQRGFPRPVGPAADIGAYEFGSPAFLQMGSASAGAADVFAFGVPGQSFCLLMSTNLATWIPFATNQFGIDGTFSFQNGIAAPVCFFRVKEGP
jgi:hypothetical protein